MAFTILEFCFDAKYSHIIRDKTEKLLVSFSLMKPELIRFTLSVSGTAYAHAHTSHHMHAFVIKHTRTLPNGYVIEQIAFEEVALQ